MYKYIEDDKCHEKEYRDPLKRGMDLNDGREGIPTR